MEEIEGVLQEYVATANNPKYKGDYSIINSKFPELKNYDEGVLQEYVATANNKKYGGDYKVINSKFPEFFEVKKKDDSQPVGETPQKVSSIQPPVRKSLLDGGGPKKPSVSASLSGGVKPVNFDNMSVDELSSFNKGEETSTQPTTLPSALTNALSFVAPVKGYKDFSTTVKKTPELKPQFDNFVKKNYESAITKMKGASVNANDLKDIEKDYQDALHPEKGTWNGIKQGVTDVMNAAMSGMNKLGLVDETGDLKVPNVLEDLRKEVKADALKHKEVLLPGQIEYRVKQKFIEKKTHDIYQSKLNLAKENLSTGEQYAFGKHKADQYANLSKENKKVAENFHETAAVNKGLISDKASIESQMKEITSKGGQIPQEIIDQHEDILHSINVNLGLMKNYQGTLNSNNKNLGTFKQEAEAVSSQNNEFKDIAQGVKGWFYGAVGNISEIVGKYAPYVIANGPAPLQAIPFQEGARKVSEVLSKKAEDVKEGVEVTPGVRLGGRTKVGDLTSDLSLKNVNEWTNQITTMTGDNLGMVAAIVSGGEIAVGLTALESAGGKSKEMRHEDESFNQLKQEAIKNKEKSFEFDGKQYNVSDYKDKEFHSELADAAVPLLWGAAMYLPAAKQLKIFKNEARMIAALEKESPDILLNSQKKSVGAFLAKNGGDYLKHTLEFAGDLKVMALSQATLDNAMGKDVDWFKVATDIRPLADAAFLTVMNKGFAHALGQTAKPWMTNEEAKTIDENAKLISYMTERMNDESLIPEEKALIKKQLDRVSSESKGHIDDVLDRMGNMSEGDYNKVVSLAKKSSELRQEASDIQNSNLIKEEKRVSLDKVKREYVENEKNLKNVRENYSPRKEGFYSLPEREQNKLKDEAGKKLVSEARERGEENFNFSNRDIVVEAVKLHEANINNEKQKAVEAENKPKGTQDEISQPIELQVLPKPTETTIPEKEAEVKRLREEEQKEYKDVSPDDKVKLGEIYNKYDKLISPILREIEAAKPVKEVFEPNLAKSLQDVNDKEYNTFINKNIDLFNEKLGSNADILTEDVAKIYFDTKADGSNPEFVKAVEDLLGKPTEVKTEPKSRSTRNAKPTEEVKVEEAKQKEVVSLPKVIDDSNFQDVVDKLMKDGKLTKPCE